MQYTLTNGNILIIETFERSETCLIFQIIIFSVIFSADVLETVDFNAVSILYILI